MWVRGAGIDGGAQFGADRHQRVVRSYFRRSTNSLPNGALGVAGRSCCGPRVTISARRAASSNASSMTRRGTLPSGQCAVLRDFLGRPGVVPVAFGLEPFRPDDGIIGPQVDIDRVVEQMPQNLAQRVGGMRRLCSRGENSGDVLAFEIGNQIVAEVLAKPPRRTACVEPASIGNTSL